MSEPAATTTSPTSNDSTIHLSSVVHLTRSKQTWTGAGSAAGFVLRYLAPMRRLMTDVTGNTPDSDRCLAILIAHLVKAGYAGHDKGRLRDFLVRGVRSAAKAGFEELKEKHRKDPAKFKEPSEPKLDAAKIDSPKWTGYWREGLLQRSWRSLERHQHAQRSIHEPENELTPGADAREDLVHDALQVAMSYPKDSPELWAGRLATALSREVTPDEVQRQLQLARIRFAQTVADEVAQTMETPDADPIQTEIKALGLQKAFAGCKVQA